MRKPIIVVADEKGNVKMKVEELKKLLDEAYQQGYDAGYNSGKSSNWWTYPTTITTPYYDTKITCRNGEGNYATSGYASTDGNIPNGVTITTTASSCGDNCGTCHNGFCVGKTYTI